MGIIALVFVYIYYRTIGIIKMEQFSESKEISTKEIKEKGLDILGMMVRPQKLTEEEVSISKEKKICLVCKSELMKKIYICPECKTFYCIKCSDALEDLENACWVCDTPFEDSKPSKPFQKEEKEEIEVGTILNGKGE